MTTLTFSAFESLTSKQQAFTTKRTGADRTSAVVNLKAMHYDEATKSIKVFCDDGKMRECRVARLTNEDAGRVLWKTLQQCGKDGIGVKFVAAGGFSPDRWFYDVA